MRLALLVVLGLGGPAIAADQAAVRAAVDRGVAYLKGRYATGKAAEQGGVAGVASTGNHAIGEAALAGIALLESGAPPTDPAVQAIAAWVRKDALADSKTYHVSLAVLLLDRLGEPADKGLVQMLGVKLYAGLSSSGGYTYDLLDGWLGDPNAALAALQQESTLSAKQGKQSAPDAPKKPPAKGFAPPPTPKKGEPEPLTGLHPAAEKALKAAKAYIASHGRRGDPGDNSNTQFGLIGLWVASRNGLPAEDAFAAIERRFLATQTPTGGWGYQGGDAQPAMTCAGLLGLAVGAGRAPPGRRTEEPKNGGGGFAAAPKPKEKDGADLEWVKNKGAVRAGLNYLAACLRGGVGQQVVGAGNPYYLLWSLERACMAYNKTELGGVDWHDWGCAFLLPAQQPDGSWPAAGICGQDVDTSFALLFLVKSNLVSDLSGKIAGTATMKAGGGDDGLPPAAAPKKAPPEPPHPLATASDAEFSLKLAALRDTRGGTNTQDLAAAIPKLTGDRQTKARNALAERFTRMTAKTLRDMMREGGDEMKRAAAVAAAAKGEKPLGDALAELIDEPTDAVVQAARSALKTLFGQDHGPPPGADAAAKKKAMQAWRAAVGK